MPFLPSLIADQVSDLTPEILRGLDIRLLMLDFDNTLVPYTTDRPSPQVVGWLAEMKEAGITLCVVSNSRKDRVRAFCKEFDLPCVTGALKPLGRGIRQCLDLFGEDPRHCALVGDQIYTDTLGANLAGVRPILVNAIHNHNFWLKLRHAAEMPFIIAARKRRINK